MQHIPDRLWREIEKLITKEEGGFGRPEFDNRTLLEGIVLVLKTGIQWRYLPEKYGCPTTVHGKYMKWVRTGILCFLSHRHIKGKKLRLLFF